ncbi:MAG: site-specific DNA-methyltransferase [Anaerolineales bacterium]|nr:site-specific DNA-methyltransferase [Anaerolineales bacterium]
MRKAYPKKVDLETRLEEFVLADPNRVVRTARVKPSDINETCRPALESSQKNPEIVFKGEREGKSALYFLNGEQLIFYSAKAKELDGQWITGQAASTIWDDLLSNNLHNEGNVRFPKGKKPEALLKRVLELCTNKNDWVLDSFAGSGTTGSVAHKMKRKWIMVELGDHCHTHIIPRLKSVIDGTDTSGITKAVNWQGGGGFRYFRLAPSLLAKDRWGNWVINKAYNPTMLAEAVCKLEGFTYAPSDSQFWLHGHSTEQDFIYVTTQTLSHEQLQLLNEEVGSQRTLLVMCAAYRAAADTAYPNLTIKKIPQAVLQRCEYGKDDYSLRVENLPQAEPSTDRSSTFAKSRTSEGEEKFNFSEEVELQRGGGKQLRLDLGGKSSTS